MMKEEMNRKAFTCSKFGFKFRIIINGTTTTAIMLQDDETWDNVTGHIGIATVQEPDVYDAELGRIIAMKTALVDYHSVFASKVTKRLAGTQNKLRNFTNTLSNEIYLLRESKKLEKINAE